MNEKDYSQIGGDDQINTGKKLLILGTSIGSTQIVQCARSMGIYTIVTDYLPLSRSAAKQAADEYWMISTQDIEQLKACCLENGITHVFAGVSEFNLDHALELSEQLNLPYYCTREAWSFARSKYRIKQLCKELEIPVAEDYTITEIDNTEQTDKVKYPVVVKPSDSCGNAGISFCMDYDDLRRGYMAVGDISADPHIIVEQMLSGTEYCSVYVLAGGECRLLTLRTAFKEPGYPTNLYVFGSTAADCVEEYNRQVNDRIIRLFKKIGCTEGIVWAQLIRGEDGVFKMLEIGYRFPADMFFDSFRGISGFDTVRWMMEAAVGIRHRAEDLPPAQTSQPVKCASVYMLFADRDCVISRISGVYELNRIPWITAELIRGIEDNVRRHSLLGRITFASSNAEEACRMMERICRDIFIEDQDGQNIVIRFTDLDLFRKSYQQGLKSDL